MVPLEVEGQREVIVREVERFGAELLDMAVRRYGRRGTLVITVDKTGGITLEECAGINRALAALFDQVSKQPECEGGFFSSEYLLEVNSPGLDRPLKTEKDFGRALGQNVRIHYGENPYRTQTLTGTVSEVREGAVHVRSGERSVAIPLAQVVKAVREIRFGNSR